MVFDRRRTLAILQKDLADKPLDVRSHVLRINVDFASGRRATFKARAIWLTRRIKWCDVEWLDTSWKVSVKGFFVGPCRQDSHSQHTSVQYSLFTARNAHRALGSSHTDCIVIFVRWKRICHLVCSMSHLWLPHLPFTTSTSSSSFTLHHDTRTHRTSSTSPSSISRQFAPSGITRREDVQSGENPRTTTPTARASPQSCWLLTVSSSFMEKP